MPGYKNCFAVTKKVWVMVVNKIATKECSSGAKKQISQGYGVMAGTHSILNVKPTYADVNGNIYQDRLCTRFQTMQLAAQMRIS